jgi:DNA-binding MarR family transcriptional regulator
MAVSTRARTRRSPAEEAWALMQPLFREHRGRFVALTAEFDLAPAQVGALLSLEPGAEIPMSELAESLLCDPSNVTGIVDRLEARCLVERRGAAHDRRVRMLALTSEGATLHRRLRARMSAAPDALSALPPADQRALRDALRRVGAP